MNGIVELRAKTWIQPWLAFGAKKNSTQGRKRYNRRRQIEAKMSIQSIEPQISRLSRAEKAVLLQRLAREVGNAWAGIENTVGVSGGEACIVRTRIPVWTLENYRRLGWTEAAILENFPSLRAVDLVNAWAYADAHLEEMDKAINANAKELTA